MKIVMILTNGFDPDPRVYKEATSLVELGNEVHILCWDRENKYINKPTEMLEGIHIVRFFDKAVYGSGYKQIGKMFNFKNRVQEYIEKGNFQAIHCHDFDGFFIGHSINRKLKLKLVYDEHDLFDMYFATRKGLLNKIISTTIRVREKAMLKSVNHHIVVTHEMEMHYSKISKKISIISNAPSKNIFKDIEKTRSSKLRIGYIGSVRYLEELKALIDVGFKFKDKVEIIISGGGIVLNELKKHAEGKENIQITGSYNINDLERLYKDIDITYAFYPSSISTISMPNKFYESIITETPIIANGVMEFGKEVSKYNIGYCLSEKSLKAELETLVEKLVSDENINNKIIENMQNIKHSFTWEANIPKLKAIYENL